MSPSDELASMFSKYLTGFAVSKALLEDYSRVIAKIEGVDPSVVNKRVADRANEIFEDVKLKS